jgi:flagellar biosynthesis protein FlhB
MSEPTEDASPKRVEQARERGQVAQSRDAVGAAALLAGLGATWASRSSLETGFRTLLQLSLRAASGEPSVSASEALSLGATEILRASAPSLFAAVFAAVLVGSLLGGFLFAPTAALPKLERLNVFESLQRYTKPRTYVEPLIALLKGALLLWLGYSAARAMLPNMVGSMRGPLPVTMHLLGDVLRSIATRMTIAVVVLAGLDVVYRRWQHAQDLRMTKEDVKREHKESEGDPHAKHAREKLHKEILAEASLDRVKKANFVVTNPTHYAVALSWDEETMDAPELIAKGEGEMARRIIEEAHRHGIAVLRDAPLARSLHELEIGDQVPELLYEAVAAVVGFLADGNDPDKYGE